MVALHLSHRLSRKFAAARTRGCGPASNRPAWPRPRSTPFTYHPRHHHFVSGQPPVWNSYSSTNVRFFRVCYRVIVPRPNEVRIKIDEMHVVVPVEPGNPNSPLMLLSTEHDENALFRRLPPEVLAGQKPDPLPVDDDGVFVEPIDPAGTFDLLAGAPAVFSTARILEAGMADEVIAGNNDQANELNNTQLPLVCWALAADGTIAKRIFGPPVSTNLPPVTAAATGPGVIELAMTPTAAIPAFSDEMGNTTDNPTMFELNIIADPDQLSIGPAGTNLEVTWPGVGVLQAADEVVGPYVDRPGLLSPAPVDPNKPQEFFRIKR